MTINPAAVPLVHQRAIGAFWQDGLKAFYADPENHKRFEKWKKEREARKDEKKDKA
jgi:hypothetical protein